MKCKICAHNSVYIFEAKILNKYKVKYWKCGSCEFIQTDDPFWLAEAYSSAITAVDIGLLYRNLLFLPVAAALISKYFDFSGNFLDYGGGYGVFTRLMRDKGFNYFRQDIYCENLFAAHFDISDLSFVSKFEMLSTFEVFEHLNNPKEELEKMLELSENIFFSTELIPGNDVGSNWWYFMPSTGQHIAFYSEKTLSFLGEEYGLNFYTNGKNLHLLSKKKINRHFFKLLTRPKIARLYNYFKGSNTSLLAEDYDYLAKLIQTKND